MKAQRLIPWLIGLAIAWVPLTSAHASPMRIPLRLYPAGAVIKYNPSVSNHALDCLWGFFCEGNVPLFHSQSQDQLHRISGWDQFATVSRPKIDMQVFASRYERASTPTDVPWAENALEDLLAQARAHGYRTIRVPFRMLPPSATGSAVTVRERSGAMDLVVMGAWTGTTEVEAVAMVRHGSLVESSAIGSLARQVQWALSVGA